LYPGEVAVGKVEKFQIVQQNQALKLTATRDFEDGNKVKRTAGDDWLVKGPFTYVPRVEEQIVNVLQSEVIKPNTALKLRAIKNCKDSNGINRKTGEEWLIREIGSYLPAIDEEVVEHIKGIVITDKKALRLEALKSFKDNYGIQRQAGDQWLVTSKLAQLHIKDVHEEIVGEVKAITLSNRQYCVILDPYDEKARSNTWGSRVMRKGEATFFLQPGESLDGGKVKNVEVLTEDEALLLQATEDATDTENQKRKAGERWLILGPREYIPPVTVKIVEKRKKIPLDENEGIYVRNKQTGEVRMETGKTYLLEAHEELYEKELPETVEYLIAQQKLGQPYVPPKFDDKGQLIYESKEVKGYTREKTRVITYRAPSNSGVQLYDFKTKQSRVIFGPSLVLLGPDEQFTLISLSGGCPKRENIIQSLTLFMGPDFMTDVIDVETSDHARLKIQLSYNWQFRFDRAN
jgi:major vault protein